VQTFLPFKIQWIKYVISGLTCTYSAFCPHSLFMCFVWIWEQTLLFPYTALTDWFLWQRFNLTGFYDRDLTLYSPVVNICTTSLTFNNSTFCPRSVLMCFVWIWEQTAIISLYNINWLVFITETECVYCAVRTEYLSVNQFKFRFQKASVKKVTHIYTNVL